MFEEVKKEMKMKPYLDEQSELEILRAIDEYLKHDVTCQHKMIEYTRLSDGIEKERWAERARVYTWRFACFLRNLKKAIRESKTLGRDWEVHYKGRSDTIQISKEFRVKVGDKAETFFYESAAVEWFVKTYNQTYDDYYIVLRPEEKIVDQEWGMHTMFSALDMSEEGRKLKKYECRDGMNILDLVEHLNNLRLIWKRIKD